MGRREQKKQEKRERLEREGLTLFLERGYDRMSIEQVAVASEVARGTFYLYYADKHALFSVLMDRWYVPVMGILSDVEARLGHAETQAECLQIYEQMGVGLAMIGLACHEEVLVALREVRRTGECGDGLRVRELALLDAAESLTRVAAQRGLIDVENPRLVSLVIMGAIEKLYYETLIGTDLGEDPSVLAQKVVAMFALTLGLPVTRG